MATDGGYCKLGIRLHKNNQQCRSYLQFQINCVFLNTVLSYCEQQQAAFQKTAVQYVYISSKKALKMKLLGCYNFQEGIDHLWKSGTYKKCDEILQLLQNFIRKQSLLKQKECRKSSKGTPSFPAHKVFFTSLCSDQSNPTKYVFTSTY